MSDKYGRSLGSHKITVGGSEYSLKPTLDDLKVFKRILFKNTNNKELLFDKFEDWYYNLLRAQHSEDNAERQREHVGLNSLKLLEEVQIMFGLTTRADLDKQKQEAIKSVKNSIGNA